MRECRPDVWPQKPEKKQSRHHYAERSFQHATNRDVHKVAYYLGCDDADS